MRVGIIALLQETNTFIAEPTTLRHFEENLLVAGETVRSRTADTQHETGGFFAGLDRAGIEGVPIFAARALPFGTVTDETYSGLKQRLLAALSEAGPLDGLLVAPHGATVSASIRDVDGDWLSAVRDAIGPQLPIISTADPHANLSPAMIDAVNGMIAYRCNPHIDQRQRGIEAAELMAGTLSGAVSPVTAAAFPPLAISIDKQCTDEEPTRSLCARFDEIRARPGILSASLFLGFPYADVPEVGSAVAVVADGDRGLAEAAALELADELWRRREQFTVDPVAAGEAVERAANMTGPVCLLDMGDNVGGGSAADGTTLAHVLHQRALGPAFVCLYDPESVVEAEAAGAGALRPFVLGGKTDGLHGDPLEIACRVLRLADGQFEEPLARHGGMRYFDQGRTAVLQSETGLTIMLTSQRMVPFSLHQLTDFGIDPAQFQFIVAKGVNAPLAAYREVCPEIIRVNTPGTTVADMRQLEFQQRRRPMFPFEADATWTPHVGHL